MHSKVSIIILHLENIRCLIDCIASLNKITYENFDIFIVHNGPKSKVLEENLAPISQRITEVINTGENVGFARGNNIGIRQALQKGAEYVLLLNDDTEVAPDFLTALINIAEVYPNAGMFGPRIFFFNQPEKIWFDGAKYDPLKSMISFPGAGETGGDMQKITDESDFITGCAVLAKRYLIENIGLLNEGFFIYWEDVDWGLRSISAGFKNLVVHNSHVWHKVAVSMEGVRSPRTVYHKVRSHLFITKLHAPKAHLGLMKRIFFDIAWLSIKSRDPGRFKLVRSYFNAIIDYHLGKTGRGPHWLWPDF